MDRFRSIQSFIKAADAGSFQRAAALQGVTPQAISKAIRQLEKELGVRLFHRSTRSSSLTEEGQRFLDRMRGTLSAFESAWSDAVQSTGNDGGMVRISATGPVSKQFLVPLIKRFQAEHQDIHFDLVVEDTLTDFVASGIDIGFRFGTEPDAQVVVRELLRNQLIICASPAYLQRHGVPVSRQDLLQHRCTGARHPNTGRVFPWEFQVGDDVEYDYVNSIVQTNDVEVEIQAILDGIGIGQVESIVASSQLRSGALVPLLLDSVSERYAVYLYYSPHPEMSRRVRLFIDFIVREMRARREHRFTQAELEYLHAKGLKNV